MLPILSPGSNPSPFIFSINSSSSWFTNVFLVNVNIVSLYAIFDTSTPIPCNFFIFSINSSIVFILGKPSTSFSNSYKSCKLPFTSKLSTSRILLHSSLEIFSNSLSHNSISSPFVIMASIFFLSSSVISPSSTPLRYFMYFCWILYNVAEYLFSWLLVLVTCGKFPPCDLTQSTTIVNNSKSFFLLLFFISLSILTLCVLFAKSITTGLSSSLGGLSGSTDVITLPICCLYNICEFSSNGLNHNIPFTPSTWIPSFNLFITIINLVLFASSLSNSSNWLAFSLSVYAPSIE